MDAEDEISLEILFFFVSNFINLCHKKLTVEYVLSVYRFE